MNVLVTGSCGFIGMHTSQKLLARGDHVFGLDSMNSYYDVKLKYSRLAELEKHPNFHFILADLASKDATDAAFATANPQQVVHLAAQAGVRYSITNPFAYLDSNLTGFLNLMEACRHGSVNHLVYASSSSVYGGNRVFPYSEEQSVDHPVSLYAATKKSNELIAHSYSHLYQIPTTGLRFFTVYGPWGRPDMAIFKFAQAIARGEPIDVYNNGKMSRDFTYIDDIVEGIIRVLDKPVPLSTEQKKIGSPTGAPYRIFNIGNGEPVKLMAFVDAIEKAMGKKSAKNFLPLQPGDVLDIHPARLLTSA